VDEIEKIRAHYEHRIARRRPGHEVVDWASEASQRARFAVLAANVDLEGKSLLDVGCGMGDLWGFLRQRGIGAAYTGIDLLAKMVAAARRRYPRACFACRDVFAADFVVRETFDVVFCSGLFNLNLGNNEEFLPQALRRLLELSRETTVFNLLHERAAYDRVRYYHYHPQDVLEIVAPLVAEARVIDDYLPNDFTVICRKTAGGGSS
jgi:SAM-dependent methyltransferase